MKPVNYYYIATSIKCYSVVLRAVVDQCHR